MKKILILLCGGTIVMEETQSRSLGVAEKKCAMQSLLDLEPKLHSLADIDLEYVVNIDSSDMTSKVWETIAETIMEKYADYDGFVISHGTDTMAYTSSALSFMLQGLGKPVILTGSQIPGFRIGNDARRNIISAVRVSTTDLAGVYVVFGEDVILGCRASKLSESGLNAFGSINRRKVAKIRVEMSIHSKYVERHSQEPTFKTGFENQVMVSSVIPGADPSLYLNLLNDGVKGFVLRGFGTGNIPSTLIPFLKECQEREVPIVVTSQCHEGRTSMSKYEAGQQALDLGVIQSYDMSLESTVVKLMWLLGQRSPYSKLPSLMHHDICGEINTKPLYATFPV